jgi:WD40 repeat protein
LTQILVAACLLPGHADANGQEPRTWALSDTHISSIAHLDYSPDGKLLASANRDGTIKLWDLCSGRVRSTLDAGPRWLPGAVAFSPDGKVLAPGSGVGPKTPDGRSPPPDQGGLTLWDVASGRKLRDVPVPPGHLRTVVYSRDGKTLALAASTGVVRLWINDSAQELLTDCPRLHAAGARHFLPSSADRHGSAG